MYGKFVKGKAIVSLTRHRRKFCNYVPPSTVFEGSVIKTIAINGTGSVEFDTTDDLKLYFDDLVRAHQFDLQATVVEELIGRNQTASKEITVHCKRYKVEKKFEFNSFQPGSPITFPASIKRQDDSPIVLDEETKVVMVGKIIKCNSTENVKIVYLKFELNSNGSFQVNIPTSRKDGYFRLNMKYMGEETEIGHFWPMTFSEPSEMKVKVLTKR